MACNLRKNRLFVPITPQRYIPRHGQGRHLYVFDTLCRIYFFRPAPRIRTALHEGRSTAKHSAREGDRGNREKRPQRGKRTSGAKRGERQKAAGAWACGYAESRRPFYKIKHRPTRKEAGEAAEGEYDREGTDMPRLSMLPHMDWEITKISFGTESHPGGTTSQKM